jgi:ribosome-associated protein
VVIGMDATPDPTDDRAPAAAPQPAGARVELAPGVFVPESALRFQYVRSSGPGGQNVNKVNTKAELWVQAEAIIGLTDAARARLQQMAGRRWTAAGEIHIAADTERRQELNREEVLARLRELLLRAMHEPKKRKRTKPTRASKRRRVEGKRHRGQIKSQRRGGGGDW